jgi:centrosomal protein CEP112
MTKIENDLQRSKMLREKQSKDFQKQLEDVQNENAAKLEQLQNDNENEKLKMKRQFEVEKLALKKETLDACAELQGQLQTQLVEINEQHKVKVEKLVLVS